MSGSRAWASIPKASAPHPAIEKAAPIPADVRLWWFLFVLNACGSHGSYANDEPGEWVAAFCDDAEPTDTFNRACDLKLATWTHNSMDETSRIWITEAGKRFLADRASQEERIREDERDRLLLTNEREPARFPAKAAYARAMDVADRLIERAYGIDTPDEWNDAFRDVQRAVARAESRARQRGDAS